ncbi:MAG: hypothetical protein OYM47_07745 [Gemmatimonadota bacterium]|nr:hypothetical protein [Gemmatimonadota bacterium]
MNLSRKELIARRRAFNIPGFGYKTLAEVGLDGDYVSPIQKTSNSTTGPILIGKHWNSAKNALQKRDLLVEFGYDVFSRFNKVLDEALKCAGMGRANVYITQAFHLLPGTDKSQSIKLEHIRMSFREITIHELDGRPVIAMGNTAQKACDRFGVEYIPVPHPSHRQMPVEERVAALRDALCVSRQIQ